MLINQIPSQQRLGQESNCTIFLTATMGINRFWDAQRAGGRRKAVLRGCKEEKVRTGRGEGFKVVLSMDSGSIFWKLEQGSSVICTSLTFLLS